MSKLNPIYILLLIFVVMLISFQLLEQEKLSMAQSSDKLNGFKQSVLEYKSLQKSVSNKKQVTKELQSILNQPIYVKANIESKIENNKAFIKLVTSDGKIMQRFVNRLINKNMKINRMEATKNYIVVEVKL